MRSRDILLPKVVRGEEQRDLLSQPVRNSGGFQEEIILTIIILRIGPNTQPFKSSDLFPSLVSLLNSELSRRRRQRRKTGPFTFFFEPGGQASRSRSALGAQSFPRSLPIADLRGCPRPEEEKEEKKNWQSSRGGRRRKRAKLINFACQRL